MNFQFPHKYISECNMGRKSKKKSKKEQAWSLAPSIFIGRGRISVGLTW